ncbi:hypothetical protein PSTG_19846, partial [Puccinia striiformis f. sp. tritici PST-78]
FISLPPSWHLQETTSLQRLGKKLRLQTGRHLHLTYPPDDRHPGQPVWLVSPTKRCGLSMTTCRKQLWMPLTRRRPFAKHWHWTRSAQHTTKPSWQNLATCPSHQCG